MKIQLARKTKEIQVGDIIESVQGQVYLIAQGIEGYVLVNLTADCCVKAYQAATISNLIDNYFNECDIKRVIPKEQLVLTTENNL